MQMVKTIKTFKTIDLDQICQFLQLFSFGTYMVYVQYTVPFEQFRVVLSELLIQYSLFTILQQFQF